MAVGHRPIERAITESSTAARRVLLAAIVVLALAGIGPGTAQEPSAPLYALFRAAQTDDAELAAFALDKGANIEALGPQDLSPLRAATLQNSLKVLMLLLERGADPAAARAEDGMTALHLAALEGHDRLIAPLIAAGAPVAARTAGQGKSALHLAAGATRRATVAALIAGGAPLDLPDRARGNTALIDAAFDADNLEIVAELVAAGARVEVSAVDGMTALHAASTRGNRAIAQLLLSAGAPRAAIDGDGRMALFLAAGNGHAPLVPAIWPAPAPWWPAPWWPTPWWKCRAGTAKRRSAAPRPAVTRQWWRC